MEVHIPEKVRTIITLDAEIIKWLDDLVTKLNETRRNKISRSELINYILSEARKGALLAPKDKP